MCVVFYDFDFRLFFPRRDSPLVGLGLPPHSLAFVFRDHTQRRTTVGRTSLDEWSACRRDLYLTTHNTHNRHPCPRLDSNPRSQQASGRRPTPSRSHWDRRYPHNNIFKSSVQPFVYGVHMSPSYSRFIPASTVAKFDIT